MKMLKKTHPAKAFAMAICILITAAGWTQKAQAASDSMTIYAIDLGASNEGEATMVVSGNGASLLIDMGDEHSDKLFKWLDSNGYNKKKFDCLITHWHDDHVVSAPKLFKNYNVGTVYLPGVDGLSSYKRVQTLYTSIRSAAKTYGTKIVYLSKGQTIKVGNSVTGKVLYVNGYKENDSSENQKVNNQSAAIMFTGGGSRFLACGDAMKAEENKILSSGVSIKADIYKASHHGYPQSNIKEFMSKVSPTYTWFTTNDASPSNYKPDSVIDYVRRAGAVSNVFSTRYNGTITFKCSGGHITVSAERNVSKMYRKIENAESGIKKTVSFTFNTQSIPRLTEKIIDPINLHRSRQVSKNGGIFTGSCKDIGVYTYFKDSTGMFAVYTLAKTSDGKYYWIENNARVYNKGWLKLNGKKYYFKPERKTGFQVINDKTYYFCDKNYSGYTASNEGSMYKGFITIKGRRCYLIDSRYLGYKDRLEGSMAKGWATISGQKYYMSEKGVIQKGFKSIGGSTYYFNTYGIMATGLRTIKGTKYYFGDNGVMQTGSRIVNGKRYYFGAGGKAATGWFTNNGKYYYGYSDGTLASGTVTIGGVRYTFDSVKNGCALLSNNAPTAVTAAAGTSARKKAANEAVEEGSTEGISEELSEESAEGLTEMDAEGGTEGPEAEHEGTPDEDPEQKEGADVPGEGIAEGSTETDAPGEDAAEVGAGTDASGESTTEGSTGADAPGEDAAEGDAGTDVSGEDAAEGQHYADGMPDTSV